MCLRCPFITAGFKILSKTARHLEIHRPGIPLWSLLTTVLFTLSLVLLTQYPYHIRGDKTASLLAFRCLFWVYILHFFALQKGGRKRGEGGNEKKQPHSSVPYTLLLPSSLNQHIKQTLKTGFLLQSSAQD